MKFVVSKQAVREYIREMFTTPGMGWQSTGDLSTAPVQASAVVDPSAAVTDPCNANFKPKNRAELRAAISPMIDGISDDDASDFYDAIRDASAKTKDEDDMDNKKDKGIEETVRRAVRKMLSEMGPYRDTGMSYSGPMIGSSVPAGHEECEACEGEGILDDGTDCKVCKGKGSVPAKGRKNKMMTDVGGASFKEIAQEMGYASESGAKQAVEKALEKARFTATMDQDELEIITLTAMNDYIESLRGSGELSSADVQLMKDHPDIVRSLDGFREFLDKALSRVKKAGQKVTDIRK